MTRRSTMTALIALAILGLALRIGAVFLLHSWEKPNAIEHRSLAISLLKNHAFYFRDFNYNGPSSVQSPTYPVLLAILFKCFGPESNGAYIAAMTINSLAGGLTVWLTYLFVRAIGGRDVVGLIAAALVAIWPSQIFAASAAQAISLITCGIVGMFYFFRTAVDKRTLPPWIGYCAVGCLAALTEPVLLPILALSGVYILFCRALPRRQRIGHAAVLFATAVLLILPWSVRNRTVHGHWIPIKSTFWVNIWKGNNPNATGTDRLEMSEEKKSELKLTNAVSSMEDVPHQYDALTIDQRAQLNHRSEAEREVVFKDFATTWISTHHGDYLKLCLKRFCMSILFDLNNPKARSWIWIGSRILLLPLTIVGLGIARKQHWKLAFPLLVWGSALLTYTLTVTANRFMIPFEPLQLSLTALICGLIIRQKEPATFGFPVVQR